jgi:aryl-alcohol dehydrogenase-like predicted oxidoreductase
MYLIHEPDPDTTIAETIAALEEVEALGSEKRGLVTDDEFRELSS